MKRIKKLKLKKKSLGLAFGFMRVPSNAIAGYLTYADLPICILQNAPTSGLFNANVKLIDCAPAARFVNRIRSKSFAAKISSKCKLPKATSVGVAKLELNPPTRSHSFKVAAYI